MIGSSPTPSPVSKLDWRHTGRLRKRENCWREIRVRGWARSKIVRRRDSLVLCKSLNTLWRPLLCSGVSHLSPPPPATCPAGSPPAPTPSSATTTWGSSCRRPPGGRAGTPPVPPLPSSLGGLCRRSLQRRPSPQRRRPPQRVGQPRGGAIPPAIGKENIFFWSQNNNEIITFIFHRQITGEIMNNLLHTYIKLSGL